MSISHTKISEVTYAMDCAEGLCDHEKCPSLKLDVCRECSDQNWDENEGCVVLWAGHLDRSEDLALDEFD